jgi:hypothetical protein
LLRRSVSDLIPTEVAVRTDKSFFDEMNTRTYQGILKSWHVGDCADIWAFADRQRLEEVLLRRHSWDKNEVRAVFRLAALGAWMNHFELGCIL